MLTLKVTKYEITTSLYLIIICGHILILGLFMYEFIVDKTFLQFLSFAYNEVRLYF
jgi:hypothetical protein